MDTNWATESDLEELVLITYAEGVAEELSRSTIIENILKLAGKRWKEASQYIPRMEFDEDDEFYGCQTNDYGDVVDPITMDEIPRERLVTFYEGAKKWCFDIESLFEYAERGKFENPLTRTSLPPQVVAKLKNYKKEKLVHITFTVEGGNMDYSFDFVEGFSLVELIVEIFRTLSASTGGDPSSVDLISRYYVNEVTGDSLKHHTDLEKDVTEPMTFALSPLKPIRGHLDYMRSLHSGIKNRYALASFDASVGNMYYTILLRYFAPTMSFIELTKYVTHDGPLLLLLPFPTTGPDYSSKLGRGAPKEIKPLPETAFLDLVISSPDYTSSVVSFLVWCAKRVINTSVDHKLLIHAFNIRVYYGDPPTFAELNKVLSYAEIADIYKLNKDPLIRAQVPQDFAQSEFYARSLGATTDEQIAEIQSFMKEGVSLSDDEELVVAVFALLPTLEYFEAIREKVPVEKLYLIIVSNDLEDVLEELSYADKLKIFIVYDYNPFDDEFDAEDFFSEIDALADAPRVGNYAFYLYMGYVEELMKYAKSKSLPIITSLFASLGLYLEDEDAVKEYFPPIQALQNNENIARADKVSILRKLILDSKEKQIYDTLKVDYIVDIYDPRDTGFFRLRPRFTEDQLVKLSGADLPMFKVALDKTLISGYEVYKVFQRTKNVMLIELLQSTYLELIDPELLFQTLRDSYELQLISDSSIYNEVRGSHKLQESFIDFCEQYNLTPHDYNVLSGVGLVILTRKYMKSIMGDRTDWNGDERIDEVISAVMNVDTD